MDLTFYPHIPQMLDWIGIWRIWKSAPQTRYFLQTVSEPFLQCGRAHYPDEKDHGHVLGT